MLKARDTTLSGGINKNPRVRAVGGGGGGGAGVEGGG